MDIYDDEGLRRPKAFALNLRRLPAELVHNVLEDLPLGSILQILAHKHEHLTKCVLSQRLWQGLFKPSMDIEPVTDLFILYTEICRFTGAAVKYKATSGFMYYSAPKAARLDMSDVVDQLNRAIRDSLPDSERQLSILRIHTSRPYPGDQADLRERWEWTKEAKRNQNRAKYQQLTLVADLMAAYPDQLLVKKPADPAQSARRNLKHIEFRFRRRATKALQNRQLKPLHWEGRCICRPGVDNIELIPYDRHLRFFLDTLKKYPVGGQAAKSGLEEEISRMSIASTDPAEQQDSRYPSALLIDIQTVLDGLAFIYTGPAWQPVVERINWGHGTEDPAGLYPRFHISDGIHSLNLPVEFHRCGVGRLLTYDDREYQWLQSFLKVVKWMKDEFGDVEVVENTTVDRYSQKRNELI